jgi:hypothetical protein
VYKPLTEVPKHNKNLNDLIQAYGVRPAEPVISMSSSSSNFRIPYRDEQRDQKESSSNSRLPYRDEPRDHKESPSNSYNEESKSYSNVSGEKF